MRDPALHPSPDVRAALPVAPEHQAKDRRAEGMLVLACALWGASFTWENVTIAGMSAARGGGPSDLLWVPTFYVGWRFVLSALLWASVFRRSLWGWTWRAVRRSAVLGTLLVAPIVVQKFSLTRTSESVCAFLTSLTIVFTPPMLWALIGKRPSRRIALGLLFGAGGVYLMTLAGKTEVKPSELAGVALGVACALGFSLHIIALDRWGRDEDPIRLTLGQFATAGVVALAAAPLFGAGAEDLAPRAQWAMFAHEGVALNLALVIVVSTIGAYGLMFRYQPRVDPNHATIIYLAEPVFASLYAWVFASRGMTSWGTAGGALILAANFVSRGRRSATPPDAPARGDQAISEGPPAGG